MAATKIKTLLCPSSDFQPAEINYAGCHNDTNAAIDTNNNGVLYLNSRVRYDEILDGTTQTILLGDISGGATLGWVSGTRSTMRNTGVRMNERDALSRGTKVAATFAAQTPRDELFETIGRSLRMAHGRST